jgi:peptide/nickel transport system permease protein
LGDEISVLSNVGFSVEAGKTIGLVGESGCGKSVTAMAITGLLPGNGRLARGSVLFDGRELTTMTEQQLNSVRGADIGMIFQEPMTSLNPAYTVSNQIAESLRIHEGMTPQQAMRRAVELLGHVGIPDAVRRANDYPHQFSGGMAQRAMIAMALACNPKLLVADEPTTALDVTTQAQILDLLSALQSEHGMSILLITHDLGVVADMCEDTVIMYAGQVVESGSANNVLRAPMHPYTAGLLASTPHFESRVTKLTTIPGTVPPAWDWPDGCRFRPRCTYAADICRSPVGLQLSDGSRSVRCARVDDIERELNS